MDIEYARVSTREQDLTGQVAELTTAGCVKVFKEKASGARGDRAELAKVLRRLEPGDVLVVTRLDRLARSTATCSTCWPPSPNAAPAFARSRTHGRTPRHHTAD